MTDQADRGDGHNLGSGDDEPVAGAELMAALVGVLDAEPADLSDGAVMDGLVSMVDLMGRLDAAASRFAAAFDSRALGAIDGARTTAGWLAARTELSRPVAGGMVHTGRRLLVCPHVDAAAGEGRLGRSKVAKLLEARKDVEELFAEHEEALVGDVEPMTVARAFLYIDEWRRIALATVGLDDGPEPAGDTGRNELRLHRTFQGRWALNGDLDALKGEALKNMLEDWIDRRVKAGAIDPTDTRGQYGHMADALIALTGIAADHETGTHQPRARINLSWDADDLLGKDIAELAELDRRRCNTSSGVTLAFAAADELMCNAEIIDLLVRFGYDNTRNILGVTHTRRYPTDRERSALNERDRGCVFPGCDAPIHWCHAHHITPYETGHTTRLEDLVLLCGHHHRTIHTDFTLARNHATGKVTVTRPDGTTIATATHGHGRDGPGTGRSRPPPGKPGHQTAHPTVQATQPRPTEAAPVQIPLARRPRGRGPRWALESDGPSGNGSGSAPPEVPEPCSITSSRAEPSSTAPAHRPAGPTSASEAVGSWRSATSTRRPSMSPTPPVCWSSPA